MVKQRNIFDQSRIDILTDKSDPIDAPSIAKQAIEAFNQGLKVVISKPKNKPITEAPLFNQFNAKQTNLF